MSSKYCGLILKTSYEKMGETSSVNVLGKSMLDWVALAFTGTQYSTAAYDESANIVELVKPYALEGYDKLVVLFSDTPLITKKTVLAAVAEAEYTSKAVIRMTRGYVFDIRYILGADKLYTDVTSYFDEEDFITAFSFKQVGLITEIMKNRILDYHMSQGVYFSDLGSVVVECDVTIEGGVTIGHNNVLSGKTRVKNGAKIASNNVITDSVICEDCTVSGARINRSYVGKGTTVADFTVLKSDCVIGQWCCLGSFSYFNNCKVGDGNKLGDYVRLDGKELPSLLDDEPIVSDAPVASAEQTAADAVEE